MGSTLGGIIGDAFGVQAIFLAFMIPFGALALYTFISRKNGIKSENIATMIQDLE